MKKPLIKKKPGLKSPPLRFSEKKPPLSQGSSPSVAQEPPSRPKDSPPVPSLQEEYTRLQRQYRFLQAEYANYKKQMQKQTEELKKYDGQFILQDFLNRVYDDFDRALKQEVSENSVKDFKKGMEMIYRSFQKILKEAGVRELNVQGALFDPINHIALGSVPSRKVPADHIAEVLKKAYLLHDKLIRPAEVIVSRVKEGEASLDVEKDPPSPPPLSVKENSSE